MTIRVDVVIPTYGRAESLARLLDGLSRCEQIEDARVVVVDDGSPDATADVVARAPLAVVYLRQENAGPAVARNRGAASGDAPLVLFIDDDCVPERRWLFDFLDAFDRAPEIDAFGGRIVPLVDTRVTRFVQAEALVDHGRGDDGVRFLVSANLGIRRSAFTLIGGFDEVFPLAAAEDVDFSFRLIDAGRHLGVIDGAAVAHEHPQRWSEVVAMYNRHGRGRVHLAAAHPADVTPIDAPAAMSVRYWKSRYARYRGDASPLTAVAYAAGRVVGLVAMTVGARSEQARVLDGAATR